MAKEPDEEPGEILLDLLPFEYAEEIGHVVAGWARLEHNIDEMIWSLAGLESGDIGACLTAQFSTVHARLNALLALARLCEYSESQIAKLNKFRDHATALAERRNRIVHDPWRSSWAIKGAKASKTYRLHKTARSKLDFNYKPVTLEELKMLRQEIEEAIKRFDGILHSGTPLF
jgi:hypothetical protein